MILLVGYLGILMYDQIVILATSLCGSYAAIFSIGMLANNFPDIYALAKKIKVGEIHSIGWEAKLYIGLILILFVVSAYYQFKKLS